MPRRTCNRVWIWALVVAVVVSLPPAGLAQVAEPPSAPREHLAPAPPAGSRGEVDVLAVLVKSWCCEPNVWDELNEEWPSFGEISIFVDETTLAEVGSFTYEDLAATGADVVVVSNPAGGVKRYSGAEIEALRRYAEEGHALLGTYLVFKWGSIDNRGLAPLFGLREDLEFYGEGSAPISNLFDQIEEDDPLFEGIPPSWESSGWPFTQVPDDLRWDRRDLAGAAPVGEGDDRAAMLAVYEHPSYTAIYISNMAEHEGNELDKQLLYNALTYPQDCELEIDLPRPEIRHGETLRWKLWLRHLRRERVESVFTVWAEGPGGVVHPLLRSSPVVIEFGDEVAREAGVPVTADWEPGVYRLVLEVDMMRRGLLRREHRFLVLP